MSEKGKEKAPSRHSTPVEREFFLQLLLQFKDVVENKKSDSCTLKAKEDAWNKIVDRFN